jgi:hypothetical protein
MDLKKNQNKKPEISDTIELQCKESKLNLEKTKLGWNLPINDFTKLGKIDRMSVDSFWVSSDDSDTDVEVEINEDENLKFNLKIKEEQIDKAKK